MTELKDRDMELNAMAASHHQQLYAWEKDRKMVLTLEHRCARLEGENTAGIALILIYYTFTSIKEELGMCRIVVAY